MMKVLKKVDIHMNVVNNNFKTIAHEKVDFDTTIQ